jgi:hypothetical protein
VLVPQSRAQLGQRRQRGANSPPLTSPPTSLSMAGSLKSSNPLWVLSPLNQRPTDPPASGLHTSGCMLVPGFNLIGTRPFAEMNHWP